MTEIIKEFKGKYRFLSNFFSARIKIDGVEFDVHLTKDKQIIVMHDDNVQRTTDGYGLIKDLTLKQIRLFHQKKNSEPVPTLHDVLDILNKKCICKIISLEWSTDN